MSEAKLPRNWARTDNGRVVFTGTPEQFKQWVRNWYRTVPRCKDFNCSHELMSCGIAVACGDCSIFSTMSAGHVSYICTDVSCVDCAIRYRCKFGHMTMEQIRSEKKIKFIEVEE